MNKSEWYVDWFNSPYYHLLYNHRNDDEANFFIHNLHRLLNLQKNNLVWDLACGKGRHSMALHHLDLNVIGTDLSVNNIEEAKKSENENLNFYVHDMRLPFKENYFDAVFNLFTSIGYFENFDDNFTVFKNVAASLKSDGVFIIDFFNANLVAKSIKAKHCEIRNKINFNIFKSIKNKTVVKRIEFDDGEKNLYFEESVSLLTKKDFETFAQEANLKLIHTFGNYNLESFNEQQSERLILIFKK